MPPCLPLVGRGWCCGSGLPRCGDLKANLRGADLHRCCTNTHMYNQHTHVACCCTVSTCFRLICPLLNGFVPCSTSFQSAHIKRMHIKTPNPHFPPLCPATHLPTQAVRVGQEAISGACKQMSDWAARVGSPKRDDVLAPLAGLDAAIESHAAAAIREAYCGGLDKQARGQALSELQEETRSVVGVGEGGGEGAPSAVDFSLAWKRVESGIMRRLVLDEGFRADGRSVDQVRRGQTC